MCLQSGHFFTVKNNLKKRVLLSDNGENLIKQEQHFTFVRLGNLPALLPNATPLVSRFFGKMSKKCQF
jgi:hypothetical protein